MSLNNLPDPPPGAHPVQLELWRRVLQRRYRQIEELSPSTFHSFANGVTSDYENSLLKNSQMDLTKSQYSSFLLLPRRNDAAAPVDDNVNTTAKQIAFHLLALFYTAIDERVPPPERQFAIDFVKRAFSLLDDTGKGGSKNDVDSDDGSDYVEGKHGRDEEEEGDGEEEDQAAQLPKKKHARKDTPRIDDTNIIGYNNDGDLQNIQSDRCNEEGEHEDERSSVSRIGAEGGEMHGLGTATAQNGTEETAEGGDGGEGVKSGTPSNFSLPVNSQNQIDDGGFVGKDATKQPDEPLPSNGGDKSMEETVSADDDVDVAEPAPSGTSNDETQMKESIEASGNVPISEHQAVQQIVQPAGERQTNHDGYCYVSSCAGDVETADEVLGNEEASSPSAERNDEAVADGARNVVDPVSDIVDTQVTTPLPPPRVYSGMRHINFYADNFIPSDNDPNQRVLVSGSLHPREPCTVQYDSGYHHLNYCATLNDETSLGINGRLAKWDPYWKIVDVLCRRDTLTDTGEPTKVSTKTALCKDETGVSNPPSSCAMVTVDLVKERRNSLFATKFANEESKNIRVWGVNWGENIKDYKSGDRRLLLRTLPLTRSLKESTQRADCHLWPKGTFIQLKIGEEIKEQVVKISQRQQQHHDPTKWSGQSSALDLTPYVQDTHLPFDVKLCCREVVRRREVQYEMGTKVVKLFDDGSGKMRPFSGVVESYDSKYRLYRIVYEDDDEEELTREEVADILVAKHGEDDPATAGSYAIHVAICEYVDPDRLFDEMTGKRGGNPAIPIMSLESVKRKAIEYLQQQTISIVESVDEGGNNSGSHVFSLVCPITKTVIETPVRGRHCTHLQCFDLRNFLHTNKHPSAGRWRCGVCQQFLSCEDLVRCGLFDAMLRDLRSNVSSIRHKVSFLASGRWKLMEQKNAKQAETLPGSSRSEDRCEPEVIDLS